MILISVKLEVMISRRQFKKDLDAERFLKRVKRVHDLCRAYQLRSIDPRYGLSNKIARMRFIKELSTAIPLKIEIINTKANQLNFLSQLK